MAVTAGSMAFILTNDKRIAYEARRQAYMTDNTPIQQITHQALNGDIQSQRSDTRSFGTASAVSLQNAAESDSLRRSTLSTSIETWHSAINTSEPFVMTVDNRAGSPPPQASVFVERGYLDSEIPSDLASLDQLHGRFPWLPNSHMVRPKDEILAQKRAYMEVVHRSYRDIGDRVLQDIFGYDCAPNDDGILQALVPYQDVPQIRLARHKFPYDIPAGTNHSVLWFTAEGSSLFSKDITEHVRREIRQAIVDERFDSSTGSAARMPSSFEFCWYENPRMTVPQVYHVQVFWRLKPTTSTRSTMMENNGNKILSKNMSRSIVANSALPEAHQRTTAQETSGRREGRDGSNANRRTIANGGLVVQREANGMPVVRDASGESERLQSGLDMSRRPQTALQHGSRPQPAVRAGSISSVTRPVHESSQEVSVEEFAANRAYAEAHIEERELYSTQNRVRARVGRVPRRLSSAESV